MVSPGSPTRQIDLTGGESVSCINTFQMEKASEYLTRNDGEAVEVQNALAGLERSLSRNQRAAIAMLLERLRHDLPGDTALR